jgi:hypothetical protein
MNRKSWRKWTMLALSGAWLLQITACFGPDPEFFIASSISSTLVANIVTLLFNALTGSQAA